jgi:hypothetical protein
MRRASPVSRERPSRHATLVETPHRGYPKPQCRALSVVWHLAAPLSAEPRDTPRRAAVPQGERRAEPCVLEFRPSSRGFPLLVDERMSPSPSAP